MLGLVDTVLAGCLCFWSGQPDLGACPVLCVVVCLKQIRVLVPVRLVCSGLGPARSVLQVDLFWLWPWWLVAFPWLKLACFLRFQKVGFFRVSAGSFVSAQFAVLGVIADSEYVDCMGNDRHSTLSGTPANLDHDRWIRSTEVKSCY